MDGVKTITYERLADFVGSNDIYAYCENQACRHSAKLDLPALIATHGNLTLPELRRKLFCDSCKNRQISISLVYTGGMGLRD